MVNWKSRKLEDYLWLANGLVLLVLLNILSSSFFFRLDLTDEKRYSIKEQTRTILTSLSEEVYVEVYLEGELNAGFRRFRNAIRETLEEFRIQSGNKLRYRFIDPATAMSEKAQNEFMAELASKGIQPTRVIDKKEGQRIEKLIFPGAVIAYGGAETGVQLLKGNKANSSEEEINQSIEGIEYELANAIYKLSNDNPKRIGLVTGHGELQGVQISALTSALLELYDVAEVSLTEEPLSKFDALIIAKPTSGFSDLDKYNLDQYLMKSGNVLFLVDKLEANMDSAAREGYLAFPYNQGLDDMLFRYGVRLNMNLVQDASSGKYPLFIGAEGGNQKVQLMDWPFFPLINRYAEHSITTNLDGVMLKFASSIDTVKAVGIKKTPLMFTSPNSRVLAAPVSVSVENIRKELKPDQFTEQSIPVAYLLEGKFTSLFKNRFLPTGVTSDDFSAEGRDAKVIVVADGDVARNGINPRTQQPQPLGFDRAMNYTFANKDLLLNMIAYLTDEDGLIKARNKEVKIRPLDKERINSEKAKWQTINLLLPLIAVALFGVARTYYRKRKYAKH